jgi:glycosyltransferase involved in cell wall biosynthesis
VRDSGLLGFAIPTYRRPELLDLALNSIVEQASPLGAPVYVADNACDHTNVEVVSKWQKIYPNITHEINETNIGIDRNVDRAIVRCPATYVHVIGDDDIILPGFAQSVMELISDSAPGHILCSYMYLLNDYRPTTGKPIIPFYGRTTTLRTFLPEHGWTLGFIGAHVFRRDRYTNCVAQAYGSYFHHIVKLLGYMGPDEALGFIESPLVGNRVDDESTPTWSGDRLNVVFGMERAFLTAMERSYSPTEVRRTIATTRRCLGYTQFMRLLYWAALAENSGNGDRYWEALKPLVEPTRYRQLRAVPRVLDGLLMSLIPRVRRLKRLMQGSGTSHS